MEVAVNVHARLTSTSELSLLAAYFVDVTGNAPTTTSAQLQPDPYLMMMKPIARVNFITHSFTVVVKDGLKGTFLLLSHSFSDCNIDKSIETTEKSSKMAFCRNIISASLVID